MHVSIEWTVHEGTACKFYPGNQYNLPGMGSPEQGQKTSASMIMS